MGIEISHDDVVITEVKNKVKVKCEFGGCKYWHVNIVNGDRDIVDGGCNAEVLSDVVARKK